jgi:hypothetical protein
MQKIGSLHVRRHLMSVGIKPLPSKFFIQRGRKKLTEKFIFSVRDELSQKSFDMFGAREFRTCGRHMSGAAIDRSTARVAKRLVKTVFTSSAGSVESALGIKSK